MTGDFPSGTASGVDVTPVADKAAAGQRRE
jgi:hypothetical protein